MARAITLAVSQMLRPALVALTVSLQVFCGNPEEPDPVAQAVESDPDSLRLSKETDFLAGLDCKTYAETGGAPVRPIGVSPTSPRYFAYAGRERALVGVSADAACHLFLSDPNLCSMSNYPAVLATAAAQKLNKIRLWVTLAGEKDPRNVPFQHVPTGLGAPYWRLDLKNQEYFDRLRAVVNLAKDKGLFVEVTFFAPFEGGEFAQGPWSGAAKKAKALKGGRLVDVGFTDLHYAVFKDTRAVPDAARNEAMREYQQNVIKWTIDELWCFDNVYWEIANEPESQEVFPVNVATWQKSMVQRVLLEEKTHAPLLLSRHLIAVQPFTTRGAAQFIGDPNIDIINGHYTATASESKPTLPDNRLSGMDLGAIDLVRAFPDKPKILGFNEGKISPLAGNAGTLSRIDGVAKPGRPESARAEAWEFLLTQGGALDHYGYLADGPSPVPPYQPIRKQLGVLRTFVDTLPLGKLKTNPRGPTFVAMRPYSEWEEETESQKRWAIMESTNLAARLFLLYVHHSTPRCKDNKVYQKSGCAGNSLLSFGGYDARIFTTSDKMYKESLRVDLGPRSGSYTAVWYAPETMSLLKQQDFTWDPKDGGTCSVPNCVIESPRYGFDILLKIVQK